MNYKMRLLIMGIALLVFAFSVTAQPTGVNVTEGPSSRGNVTLGPGNVTAVAGNVTAITMSFDSLTDVWAGFYGNITGTIVLENAAGNNFYDWSMSSITGQVFAVRETVADWSSINCTNSTMWETEETSLGIATAEDDGINETFTSTAHPSFLVASRNMTSCPSTRPYNSTETSSEFWNVLLNTDIDTTVYTSLLADGSDAFDGGAADFELLVPANKSSGSLLYYFYAELD